MSALTISGELTAEDVYAVAVDRLGVRLDDPVLAAVAAGRAALEDAITSNGGPIYGVTTGLGALVKEVVPLEQSLEAQVNLLRSHAAGTGPDLPREVVRGAMLLRLASLARGHSGVRRVVLEQMAALLNADQVPCVPRTGSLGASGDLAPSAHAFLPLIGEGEVMDSSGERLGGGQALARLGLEPLVLQPKEALALINGTHFMASIGALLTVRVGGLLDSADAVAASSLDALSGSMPAFEERVHALRPLPGQVRSAANVRAMVAGSERVARDARAGRVQDAYSLRCVPQVHGAAREGFAFFARLVDVDLNAVTDNPLVFDGEVISAGNFHGQSLALAFDTLRLALTDLASISERRTFRLLSPSLGSGLPAFLSAHPGVSSGYMVAQYTAVALLVEMRALSTPVSVDSVPTSDNQEDHVSMGMTAALLALEVVDRLERVLGIELLCAVQGLDAAPGRPGTAVGFVYETVRDLVPPLVEDRALSGEIEVAAGLVRDGAPADALAAALGSDLGG